MSSPELILWPLRAPGLRREGSGKWSGAWGFHFHPHRRMGGSGIGRSMKDSGGGLWSSVGRRLECEGGGKRARWMEGASRRLL
jgi:hypothetical protein